MNVLGKLFNALHKQPSQPIKRSVNDQEDVNDNGKHSTGVEPTRQTLRLSAGELSARAAPKQHPTSIMSFPYSYISCPCTDTSGPKNAFEKAAWGKEEEEDSEEKTFDPRYLRTNFSLYPLDHLMWCEDCHDVKCARCTIEEIVGWYCPSCLFETPSSLVRTEGNR
jgi:hypothetical protein